MTGRKAYLIYVLLISLLMILSYCKKSVFTALDNSTLIVTVNPTSIPLGGEAVVRVVGYKPNGAPLHDGTVIFFSTDLGSIESQKKTENGIAEATFIASGEKSGVATITVSSGNAVSTPDAVTVSIGSLGLKNLTISADPPTLPQGGGMVNVVVVAFDESMNPLAGLPIVISTTAGNLNSGGKALTTDSTGTVEDHLQTSESAEVTATSSEISATVNVEVKNDEMPTATFAFSPTNPVVGEKVFFNGSESSDSDGTIVSYHWNFGDGRSADGKQADHRYKSVGTYMVTLTVKDNAGNENTARDSVTVTQGQLPSAEFNYSPQNPAVNETVFFNASGSSDSDGEIVGYSWDFGDGNSDYGVTAEHKYQKSGTYKVTLVVTDDDGNNESSEKDVTVGDNSPPDAEFEYSPTSPGVNEEIYFNASLSSDSDGTIVSYAWDFGDSTTATGMTTSHRYASAGSYVVILTVTDNDNGSSTERDTINITASQLPSATFDFVPQSPNVGEQVYFDASDSTSPNSNIVSYDWDFGDSSTGTGVDTTHIYNSAGSYTVQLSVTDGNGNTDKAIETITVGTGTPPVAAFDFSPESPKVGESVEFNGSSSTDEDGTIVSYQWTFGDGTTGTGETASHTFNTAGTFNVVLKVTDDSTNTDTVTHAVTVAANQDPIADFVSSPLSPTVDQNIQFNASGSSDPDGTIVSYEWDFGDGNTQTGETASHAYNSTGTYRVTLKVTDNDGASATQTQNITVN